MYCRNRVLVAALVALSALCASARAQQSAPEIGFNAGCRAIEGRQVVDVTGWTNYPDGSVLYAAVSYMGDRFKWCSAVVNGGKFAASMEIQPRNPLPPSVYGVEVIFYREKQDVPSISALPFGRASGQMAVGTPQDMLKARKDNLDELRALSTSVRDLYNPLREIYLRYEGEPRFNARKWEEETTPWLNKALEVAQSVMKHRTINAVLLFPVIEEGLDSFSQYLIDLPATMRGYLGKDVREKGAMAHIGAGMFLEMVDEVVNGSQATLTEQIALKEKMGDEHLICAWILGVDGAFKELIGKHAELKQAEDRKTREWPEFQKAFAPRVSELEKGLAAMAGGDFFREYPARLESVRELLALLKEVNVVCDSALAGSADAEAVETVQRKFRGALASVVSFLGILNTVVVSLPPADSRAPELTPEIEAQIKADIAVFAGNDPTQCRSAGMRVARQKTLAIPFLIEGLSSADRNTALWCARFISLLADPRLIPALIDFLRKNPDKETRQIVVESVGIMGSNFRSQSVPFLLEQIVTDDFDIKMACIQGMRMARSPLFVPALCDCLLDPNVEMREQTAIVIQVISGKNVYERGYKSDVAPAEMKTVVEEIKTFFAEVYPPK